MTFGSYKSLPEELRDLAKRERGLPQKRGFEGAADEISKLRNELEMERKFPERFCMEETIKGQDKTIDRLSAENKRLREALEWYGQIVQEFTRLRETAKFKLQHDGGDRARTALGGQSDA